MTKKGVSSVKTVEGQKHFGVPLEDSISVANADMVEHITTKAIDFIREHGLNQKRIFQKVGDKERVGELRAKIERGSK